MNRDALSELEARLRHDAQRVLKTRNQAAPIVKILQRHHRRQQRNTLVRIAGLILLALAVPTIWIASAPPDRSPDHIATVNKSAQSDPTKERVVPNPSALSKDERTHFPRRETTEPSASFVKIVLVGTNVDGDQVLMPGLYIPERSESIDLSRLSQAEQRAVREVLGLQKKPRMQRPI